MIYLFVALVLALATVVIQNILHFREKEEIFNRFMAGDYRQYEYYKKEYEGMIREKEKRQEDQREKRPSKEEVEAREKAKQF